MIFCSLSAKSCCALQRILHLLNVIIIFPTHLKDWHSILIYQMEFRGTKVVQLYQEAEALRDRVVMKLRHSFSCRQNSLKAFYDGPLRFTHRRGTQCIHTYANISVAT